MEIGAGSVLYARDESSSLHTTLNFHLHIRYSMTDTCTYVCFCVDMCHFYCKQVPKLRREGWKVSILKENIRISSDAMELTCTFPIDTHTCTCMPSDEPTPALEAVAEEPTTPSVFLVLYTLLT